jgi:hypothetical protein
VICSCSVGYTGLAYCDVIRLTAKNVVVGGDGDKWISMNSWPAMLSPIEDLTSLKIKKMVHSRSLGKSTHWLSCLV